MIPEIPSIDPASTCLHAENPQATAIVLKWRTFQKLILLPGPEKTCTRPRKKYDTLVGRIRYILCQACSTYLFPDIPRFKDSPIFPVLKIPRYSPF